MSKKRRESRMGDRTGQTAEDRDQGFGSNTLKLPEDMEFIELAKRKNLNIVPYPVTMAAHPDIKDGYPAKGDKWWRKPILVHKNIGIDNNTYICLKTIGKPCPICQEVELLSQEYKTNEKIIAQIRAKKRDIFCVQDADDTKAGIQIFDVSYHLFTKLLLKEIDEGPDGYRYFAEPEDGLTVVCRFEEETYQKSKFWKIDRIDFEKRDDYSSKLLKQAPELDEMLVVLDYDALKNVFIQMESETDQEREEEPDSEPDDKETHDPEPEHDDDPVPEKEEEEEEKEPPARRPSSRGSKTSKDECPHGHTWAEDCGAKKECKKECEDDVWEKCKNAKDALNE